MDTSADAGDASPNGAGSPSEASAMAGTSAYNDTGRTAGAMASKETGLVQTGVAAGAGTEKKRLLAQDSILSVSSLGT